MARYKSRYLQLIKEIVSLSTPRGRLILLSGITVGIYFSEYEWFSDLSLWQRVGWETAPSIGLTRAYWLVLHGQFTDAWNRNLLIYPVLVAVLSLVMLDILKIVKKIKAK